MTKIVVRFSPHTKTTTTKTVQQLVLAKLLISTYQITVHIKLQYISNYSTYQITGREREKIILYYTTEDKETDRQPDRENSNSKTLILKDSRERQRQRQTDRQ